jgi:uncharacterized membrane protein
MRRQAFEELLLDTAGVPLKLFYVREVLLAMTGLLLVCQVLAAVAWLLGLLDFFFFVLIVSVMAVCAGFFLFCSGVIRWVLVRIFGFGGRL